MLNEVADASKSTWSSLTSYFTASKPSTPTSQSSSPQPAAPEDLWDPAALAISTYPAGSVITNHFLVLSRTPTSILVRCGDSPLTSPDAPRENDGLFEMSATTNFEKGYAEFQLKSVFYNGTEANRSATKGMGGFMWYLHQQYAKLWMENAVRKCRLSRWRSEDAQKAEFREKKRDEKDAARK